MLALIRNPLHEAEQQSLREYLDPFYDWNRCPHIARYRAEGKREHCLTQNLDEPPTMPHGKI